MGEAGLLLRQDQQYHWENAGYGSLQRLPGRPLLGPAQDHPARAARRAGGAGDRRRSPAADLREEHWDAFYGFYMDTGARKWGRPYLNRRFFSLLSERMADRVLLVMARRGGRWIAGALNLIGADTLYGRNWGAVEDVPFLHFELCYYQAIEQAVARGLKRAWRPAPRASTRSRAAICPRRSTPPTGSPTRACASPSPASSTRSGRR